MTGSRLVVEIKDAGFSAAILGLATAGRDSCHSCGFSCMHEMADGA